MEKTLSYSVTVIMAVEASSETYRRGEQVSSANTDGLIKTSGISDIKARNHLGPLNFKECMKTH